jgi:hypothetical protein
MPQPIIIIAGQGKGRSTFRSFVSQVLTPGDTRQQIPDSSRLWFMLLSESAPTQTPGSRKAGARSRETLLVAFLILTITVALFAGCAFQSSSMGGQDERLRQRERRVIGNNQPSENSNARDGTTRTEMSDTNDEKTGGAASSAFYLALRKALRERRLKLENVCEENDPVSRRVLEDYGAMFLAERNVLPPPVCMFTSEAEVLKFQREARPAAALIGGAEIELQPAAMNALLAAREEARSSGLDITPRGGAEAARRSYDDTLRLWNTRFLPALTHWSKLGRLSKEEVASLRQLPLRDQVREVLELEKEGIFFSKDFSKSILYSIAAPGTSQHIAMLALDVDQFMNERVRRILARHGWFQTVKSDLPHFTYLGLEEADLPAHGLRAVVSGKQLFWIPNVSGE